VAAYPGTEAFAGLADVDWLGVVVVKGVDA